jgi:hypothetical protein
MKNNKFTNVLGLLMIAGTVLFTSCNGKKTNEAPEPDKETFSSTDAAIVHMIVTDIGEIGAQVCETQTSPTFNSTITAITGSTLTYGPAVITNNFNQYAIQFNNTVGYDGKVRNGNIAFTYTPGANNATYYRVPQFTSTVVVTGYIVDGYTVNVNSMKLDNVTPTGFNPASVNLTWNLAADVNIIKPDGKTLTWKGTITRELLNTNAASTYSPTGTIPIKIQYAKLGYYGDGEGVTTTGGFYYTNIAKETMLTRDYTCAPEKILYPERHPFISGRMTVEIPSKEDRFVDFGMTTCDYNLTISIDGITYHADVYYTSSL